MKVIPTGFVPEECLLTIMTQQVAIDTEKKDVDQLVGAGKIEKAFNQKFDAILSFVQNAEIGSKGDEITEMLEKFRHEIHFLCTFNDGYTKYAGKLEAIKNKILEKYHESEQDSLTYYEIIQKSLEYIAAELGFDYVGIWKDISDEQNKHAITPIHQIGNTTLIKEDVLFEEIAIAKRICSGRAFIYNFPSDSSLGLVDIIYIFKNSLGQPIGYLVMDNIGEEIILNNSEKIAIITYFYNELKNIIKEHELSLSMENIKQLQKQNIQLGDISERDPMTGLYNRKALLKVFNVRLEDYNRLHIPITVIMIDIDHFKKINDTYGHPVGDEVIKFIGSILTGTDHEIFMPRSNDYFFRMGGEEFLGVLSNVTSAQAEAVCERIRHALEKHIFTTPDGKKFSITASFGITQVGSADIPKEYLKVEIVEVKIPDYAVQIISRADKALYNAKNGGRNCIKLFTEEK